MPESISEKTGLQLIEPSFREILSIGISTAGYAEMKMASLAPQSRITATTLDRNGAELVEQMLLRAHLDDRITVKIEDIARTKPAQPGRPFDFVYARLILHYLAKDDLRKALKNIHDSMKVGSTLYVVVRSDKSPEAKQSTNVYDPITGLTTYEVASKGKYATRYFHTKQSICDAMSAAGFIIESTKEYKESLSPNFDRSGMPVINYVIEVQSRRFQ